MKIAIPSLPVSGHINPMMALARALKARGHDVTLISTPDAEPTARVGGIPFASVGADQFPAGATAQVAQQLGRKTGDAGLQSTFGLISLITRAIIKPLGDMLRDNSFEGALFDTYQPYLELTAIRLGIPYVHVSNAAHFDVSARMPLCFYDWPPDTTPSALARNRQGVERFRELLEPSRRVARRYADEVGLLIDWDDLTATRSRLAWLTQIPSAFDLPAPPPNLIHAGPFSDPAGRATPPFDFDRLTAAPLIYASMGTLQTGLVRVFQTILDVARDRQHLQFVMALGSQLDLSGFDCPDNVLIAPVVPQLDLLKRSALCITHAGLNTTLEALAEGVPLVAIPVTNDQPGVAARIRHSGAGDFVALEEVSTARLGALVDRVLADPSYRDRAEQIARAMVSEGGSARAALMIERALRGTEARASGTDPLGSTS